MKQEYEEYLAKTFPLSSTYTEVNDGWFNLLKDLCSKLEPLFEKENSLSAPEERIVPHQIKEKFGGLRFYISSGTDEMFDLIKEAEKKSITICEDCGAAGKVTESNRWLRTLCSDCVKK